MAKWHRWGLRDNPFFQAELTHGPDAPHPVEKLLVGREEETRIALGVFEDETDARCIVEGDPGVGKTSFVNHLKAELVKSGVRVRTEIDPVQVESTTTARDLESEFLRVILRLRAAARESWSATQALAETASHAVSSEARSSAAFWDDADARVRSRTTTAGGVSGGVGFATVGYQRQRARQQADVGPEPLHSVFEEAVDRFHEEFDARVLFHIDNLEFLSEQDPDGAAVLVRDLRPYYTTRHSYWIFVGTSGLERRVFRHHRQVSGFFKDAIRLRPLTSSEVGTVLAGRYRFLQKGMTPYTAPVDPVGAAALYSRYEGDLRNFLRLLESACLMSGEARTLSESDILQIMAPRYLEALRDAVGSTVLRHLERTVLGPVGSTNPMIEFRQTDMQRRAGIKGPATKHALEQLLAHKHIVFSHQTGTNKFYRITGETSVALGLGAPNVRA